LSALSTLREIASSDRQEQQPDNNYRHNNYGLRHTLQLIQNNLKPTMCILSAIAAANCAIEIRHLAADSGRCVAASQNATEQFFRHTRPFVVPAPW
jgi:hypothetical protein